LGLCGDPQPEEARAALRRIRERAAEQRKLGRFDGPSGNTTRDEGAVSLVLDSSAT